MKITWIFIKSIDHLNGFLDFWDFSSHTIRWTNKLTFNQSVLIVLLIQQCQYSLCSFLFTCLLNVLLFFNKKNTMNFALGTFFYNSCCCCSVNDDISHLNLFFKMIWIYLFSHFIHFNLIINKFSLKIKNCYLYEWNIY